jgi:hypothetical protein
MEKQGNRGKQQTVQSLSLAPQRKLKAPSQGKTDGTSDRLAIVATGKAHASHKV